MTTKTPGEAAYETYQWGNDRPHWEELSSDERQEWDRLIDEATSVYREKIAHLKTLLPPPMALHQETCEHRNIFSTASSPAGPWERMCRDCGMGFGWGIAR